MPGVVREFHRRDAENAKKNYNVGKKKKRKKGINHGKAQEFTEVRSKRRREVKTIHNY